MDAQANASALHRRSGNPHPRIRDARHYLHAHCFDVLATPPPEKLSARAAPSLVSFRHIGCHVIVVVILLVAATRHRLHTPPPTAVELLDRPVPGVSAHMPYN
eukprot:TRINITY_DN552_c1_g1_i7.p3 TRINITY_DN552_c1_g1~~TRINITY_DN552_c1_g1_i7.p3  ORF type:complete len:103 (-),score=14.60 TRINITY_DN552_c1_g1_i7:147-455(-)